MSYKSIGIKSGVNLYALGDYIPKSRGVQDEHSKMLLAFKNGDDKAVTYFYEKLKNFLIKTSIRNKKFVICTVPSSTKGHTHQGFAKLFKKLSYDFEVANTGNILKRTESKEKAHLGGSRSVSKNLRTLKVSSSVKAKYSGIPIILFDDVSTTGSSMLSAILKLQEAKQQVIGGVVLAKTTSYSR